MIAGEDIKHSWPAEIH